MNKRKEVGVNKREENKKDDKRKSSLKKTDQKYNLTTHFS